MQHLTPPNSVGRPVLAARPRGWRQSLLLAAALGMLTLSARASVIVLSGGDPGEGYAPGNITYSAYYFTYTPGYTHLTNTIQGVSFRPFDWLSAHAGVTLGPNIAAYPAGNTTTFPVTSANDTGLTNSFSQVFLYTSPYTSHLPLSVTLSGLVPGNAYQLDLFWHTAYNDPVTYTSTGFNGPFVDTVPGVAGTYYDVRNNLVADSLGNISVVATNNMSDPDAPYLSGFSLTSVPEPSALLLLGLGGLLVGNAFRKRAARGQATGRLLAAGMVTLTITARASVITLSGGDFGEGYAPGNTTYYAYHFWTSGSGATDTMQNVTFLPFNIPFGGALTTVGSASIVNGTTYGGGAPVIGGSANDAALRDIRTVLAYGSAHGGPSAMKLTLSGLSSGTLYQLDLFWQLPTGVTPATYTITDANGSQIDTVPGVGATYYDVRETVMANALGQVSVLVTNTAGIAGVDVPYLNAFSLTSVPEPSTLLLLGVGALLLARWRAHRGEVISYQ